MYACWTVGPASLFSFLFSHFPVHLPLVAISLLAFTVGIYLVLNSGLSNGVFSMGLGGLFPVYFFSQFLPLVSLPLSADTK